MKTDLLNLQAETAALRDGGVANLDRTVSGILRANQETHLYGYSRWIAFIHLRPQNGETICQTSLRGFVHGLRARVARLQNSRKGSM